MKFCDYNSSIKDLRLKWFFCVLCGKSIQLSNKCLFTARKNDVMRKTGLAISLEKLRELPLIKEEKFLS